MPEKKSPTPVKDPKKKSYPAWMGFARREFTPRGNLKLKINYGRVLMLFVALFVLGWTSKTVALFYFFRDVRKFSEVTLADTFLFPMNRAAVRVGQGNYQIEQGKAAIEREEYRRAYMLLREGVARAPANLEGRELLAQIYLGWRPDLAVELLIDGLATGEYGADYLRLLFALLLQQRQDHKLMEISETLLQEQHDLEVERLIMAFRMQSALMLGRYKVLEEIFASSEMERTLDGILIATQFFRKIGEWQKAAALLSAVLRSPAVENSPQLYAQFIDTLKSGGELARAREVALELTIRNPMEWRPRIRLIDLLSASGLDERRDREIRSLLQEHRNDEEAMTNLAGMVAEYGNVWAASRLYELALENGFNLGIFSLSLAESMIRADRFTQAIELCNELARENPVWLVNAESSFNAIRSLAYFGSGNAELGILYLNNFLSARGTSVAQLYRAAMSFKEKGFPERALEILEEAYRRDANNEQVLAALIDVEMQTGAFFSVAAHLRSLFELRRPDYAILERVLDQLRGDRFLYTAGRIQLLEELERTLDARFAVSLDLWSSAPPEDHSTGE